MENQSVNHIDPNNFFSTEEDSKKNREVVEHTIVYSKSNDCDYNQNFGSLDDLHIAEIDNRYMDEEDSHNSWIFEDPLESKIDNTIQDQEMQAPLIVPHPSANFQGSGQI